MAQCEHCKGLFDPLSRQASQNAMGPWFLRDEHAPFRPGFSYETLKNMVLRGRVTRDSVIRGPTTRQFWTQARFTPGVAHLLGECHACHTAAQPEHTACSVCGAWFAVDADRQHLGLGPVHLLPGHAPPEAIAASVLHGPTPERRRPDEGVAAPPLPADEPAPSGVPPQRRSPGLLLAVIILLLSCVLLTAALLTILAGPEFGIHIGWLDDLIGRRAPAVVPATAPAPAQDIPESAPTLPPAPTPSNVTPPAPAEPAPPPPASKPATEPPIDQQQQPGPEPSPPAPQPPPPPPRDNALMDQLEALSRIRRVL